MELPRTAIVSRRHGFIYVPVPKCGTTTMIRALAALHGLERSGRVRRMLEPAFWTPDAATDRDAPLAYYKISPTNRAAFFAAHEGMALVSIVREPVARAASNYRNKLNRFASRFARPAYWAGKLAAYALPFGMRRQLAAQNGVMRMMISPDGLVTGLRQHGVLWDRHFWPQAQVLALDRLTYAALLHLEHLEDELRAFLVSRGVEGQTLEQVFPLPRHNVSSDLEETRFSQASLAALAMLYAADFDALGYAPPEA
ncbi:MAG: sulfotransferase family 2 domain-containing protein [Notoacmeibacter sp.]|nr:sulfotransferase family 2 domain-containing protein [Notoacmeibacter sp.]